jgi:hypothetical protein
LSTTERSVNLLENKGLRSESSRPRGVFDRREVYGL